MLRNLRYGSTVISLAEVAADTIANHPVSMQQTNKQSGLISQILTEADIDSAQTGLVNFINPDDSVAIVASDHTRPTGSNIYIPLLLKKLEEIGVGSITIIVALGLHRPSTRQEIERICGGPLPADVTVCNHSAYDNLTTVGSARFNTEAMQADKLIVTGAVTFHPMAGFSGGRKSLLPGIASAEDIYANHQRYFDGVQVHDGVGPGTISGNPVSEDIRDKTADCGEVWALNVVLTEKNEIEFAACGMVDDVWERCCCYVAEMHAASIEKQYDTVIASAGGTPSDISFYQSMKVLTNSSRACKSGGNLIILSDCTKGWEIREELFSYFSMDLAEIARTLQKDFSMDGLALYMALKIIRGYNVWFMSSLPREEVEAAGMQYIENEKHLEQIMRMLKSDTAIIENGSSVLPMVREYAEVEV